MRIAYFDCSYGAAGDMLLACLLDAGLPVETLLAEIAKIKLPPDSYKITIDKTSRCSLASTKVDVHCQDQTEERHLSEILEIIKSSDITAKARDLATRIFTQLAHAEAKVHGVTIDEVHFHEVGAIDAIIDIVGFAIAYDLLGIEKSVVSKLAVGSGFAKTRHGLFPIPGPAVVEMLNTCGVPILETAFNHECLTPTGAAILTTIAGTYGQMPEMTKISATGYGAGTFNPQDFPNIVRVIIGETSDSLNNGSIIGDNKQFDKETIAVLEANIDDCSPQIIAHALSAIAEAGALDVFVSSVQMKKGRSGHLLTVLCQPADKQIMEGIIISETTTLGVRSHLSERVVLRRSWKEVKLSKGDIVRLKIAQDSYGKVMNVQAEFDDCAQYARKHNLPVKQVLAEALANTE